MKTMKKKIFTKATFLFLALILMLAPLAFNAVAANDTMQTADEYSVAQVSEMAGEYILITMSSGGGGHTCSVGSTAQYCSKHPSVMVQSIVGCGCEAKPFIHKYYNCWPCSQGV